MDTELLAKLFARPIGVVIDADEINEDAETPALLAREAAKHILALDEDEPFFVCESDGAYIVSGARSAILVSPDNVELRSLEDIEQDDDDFDLDIEADDDLDLDFAFAADEDLDEKCKGGKHKTKSGKAAKMKMPKDEYESEYPDEDKVVVDDENYLRLDTGVIVPVELTENMEAPSCAVSPVQEGMSVNHGDIMLQVNRYALLDSPPMVKKGEQDASYTELAREAIDDAILGAVLKAKPGFLSEVRATLKNNPAVSRYGYTIREASDYDQVTKVLSEHIQMLVHEGGTTVISSEVLEGMGAYDSALASGRLEEASQHALDLADIMEITLNEKLIPIPPMGKDATRPYNTGAQIGKGKSGSVSRLKGESEDGEDVIYEVGDFDALAGSLAAAIKKAASGGKPVEAKGIKAILQKLMGKGRRLAADIEYVEDDPIDEEVDAKAVQAAAMKIATKAFGDKTDAKIVTAMVGKAIANAKTTKEAIGIFQSMMSVGESIEEVGAAMKAVSLARRAAAGAGKNFPYFPYDKWRKVDLQDTDRGVAVFVAKEDMGGDSAAELNGALKQIARKRKGKVLDHFANAKGYYGFFGFPNDKANVFKFRDAVEAAFPKVSMASGAHDSVEDGEFLLSEAGLDEVSVNKAELEFAKKALKSGRRFVVVIPASKGAPLYTDSLTSAKVMSKEYKGSRVLKIAEFIKELGKKGGSPSMDVKDIGRSDAFGKVE